MTLPSFLKTVDLKHLLKALNATHRAHPLPFYLLKTPKAPSAPPRPHYLSLRYSSAHAAEPSPTLPSSATPTNSQFGVHITSEDCRIAASTTWKIEFFSQIRSNPNSSSCKLWPHRSNRWPSVQPTNFSKFKSSFDIIPE